LPRRPTAAGVRPQATGAAKAAAPLVPPPGRLPAGLGISRNLNFHGDFSCNVGKTCCRREFMNSDQIAGKLRQFAGKAKEQWGRLTDDDWQVIAGRRDQLIGKIQERYGIEREMAERQVADFERMVGKD
jgi:uncharacterized protein YjbJ (UPF0337 family)